MQFVTAKWRWFHVMTMLRRMYFSPSILASILDRRPLTEHPHVHILHDPPSPRSSPQAPGAAARDSELAPTLTPPHARRSRPRKAKVQPRQTQDTTCCRSGNGGPRQHAASLAPVPASTLRPNIFRRQSYYARYGQDFQCTLIRYDDCDAEGAAPAKREYEYAFSPARSRVATIQGGCVKSWILGALYKVSRRRKRATISERAFRDIPAVPTSIHTHHSDHESTIRGMRRRSGGRAVGQRDTAATG